MKELSIRAVIIGCVISVVLGAANAYLGLRAGMTIAATYPAAVISLAILRLLRGSILEENIARTIGSVGESMAAGAIFTLPSFFIAGVWPDFFTQGNYLISTAFMLVGGILGIAFIALLRKVMVEDTELPYPESIAAAEIHKTGNQSAGQSKFLFGSMAIGALIKLLGEVKLFPVYWEKFVFFAKQTITGTTITGKGGMLIGSPGISPAYIGVGYIIGPRLAALNFSGTLIAWGMIIPMFLYLLGPTIDIDAISAQLMLENPNLNASEAITSAWVSQAYSIWKFIVRPIAIGGMLVAAINTLYKMRKTLFTGLRRSMKDIRSVDSRSTLEHDRDLDIRWIALIIGVGAIATFLITYLGFDSTLIIALIASTVLIIISFFLSAIAGYIVGIIGSSNNPISGLTLTALVVTALILLLFGATGTKGIAVVLAVAAIVCIAAAIAGEMLQDLKVGQLLKGTPAKMEIGDMIGVLVSAIVMFLVLALLNQGDIAKGINDGYAGGFGSKSLPAPQANLIAMLAKGIIEGSMSWPLIIAGMLMGIGFIAMQAKSPMLIFIGMYLPIETTFAIFIGGMIKGLLDWIQEKRKVSEVEKLDTENKGVLIASGLIAGEAMMGLVIAVLAIGNIFLYDTFSFFTNPPVIMSLLVLALLTYLLVYIPLKKKTN